MDQTFIASAVKRNMSAGVRLGPNSFNEVFLERAFAIPRLAKRMAREISGTISKVSRGMFIMNNTSSLLLVLLLLICFVTGKSQTNTDRMDTRREKNSSSAHHFSVEKDDKLTTLAIDLSALGENARVLFFDNTCVIIEKDNSPYILNASTEFDPALLPITIQEKVYNVVSISLSIPFDTVEGIGNAFPMPKWLSQFGGVKYLTLEHINLEPAFFFEHSELKHLVIIGMSVGDKSVLINNISELTSLEYLVYDESLSLDDISDIRKKAPKVVVLSEKEYDIKLENGEITLPD